MNPVSKYSLPKPLGFSTPKSTFLKIKTLVLKESQCRFSGATQVLLNHLEKNLPGVGLSPLWHKAHLSLLAIMFVSGVFLAVLFGRFHIIPYVEEARFVMFFPRFLDRWIVPRKKWYEKVGPVLCDEHPDSVRVRLILKRIIQALQSDLGVSEFGSENAANSVDDRNVQAEFSVGTYKGLSWDVVVVDKPGDISFASPGGKIVLHRGLLQKLESDAEVASVIAHQVGHVVARHPSEEFIRVMGVVIVKIIFILELTKVGFYGYINFNNGVNLLTLFSLELPWSRSAEMEADYIGLLVMASAGYDPRVAPMVYKSLSKYKTDILLTHPTGKKRAEALLREEVMEEARTRFHEALDKMKRTQ